jgi:enediyne biosynthesis protein E4
MRLFNVAFVLLLTALIACQEKADTKTLFVLKSADDTGITFSNDIEETDTFNILTYEYIYNGGGVGVADFNNDGLQDIFFAGNLVANQIYLNKGNLKFENVTEKANVNQTGRWNSGVSIVDINNDGWMDVYVSATMKLDSASRRNMLFVNKGADKEGVPVFEDQARAYGIDDSGFSTSSAFFDYDRDGDLDLYVLTNERLPNVPTNYRPKIIDGSSPNNDRLYKNNGNGTFTNVSREAGISIEGFGLGLSISDFNLDGWPDIYVSNDYLSNDLLYINNGNGTFTNKIAEYIGHQSQFSMGNDAADINNDAMPDIITLDMLPETNNRIKTTISNKSYQTYINNERFQYEYQYVRNMLHLNNGLNSKIKFSEVGMLAGVHQTEWSWSPLFADFDNDGNKDLVITNGFPKDITDKDFGNYRNDVGNVATPALLVDSIPVVKIPNYAFRNNGNLSFTDVTKAWGLGNESFSDGAAFADLDNDGDLDYVVNNINEAAFVYENTLYTSSKDEKQKAKNNFLRIQLKGGEQNKQGVGAKVTAYYGNGIMQFLENSIYRGFLSSSTELHFGLGNVDAIDSIKIQWADGRSQRLQNVKTNQLLTINYAPMVEDTPRIKAADNFLFTNVTKKSNVFYKHVENDYIDFNTQRTVPHKFSQSGPGICVGDINGDGLEDFIVGGASVYSTSVFVQSSNGSFSEKRKALPDADKKQEDAGLLLFDADLDGDLDLYIVSGSVESSEINSDYQDRFYLNNGKGEFKYAKDALPQIEASGSCVRAADFDADGDLDLFVGGSIVPQSYPMPSDSYILQNDQGKFTDVTQKVCPEIRKAGIIKDALWSDFDNDGKIDLVLAGEFMPVTFFKNNGAQFNKVAASGIENQTGWWNSIAAGDFDRDGDTDYVVGNLGLNNIYQVSNEHPLNLYAKDFDGNGSVDPIMACYIKETTNSNTKKLYPVHFWDELNSQSPKFRRKFTRYRQYGKATLEDVLLPEELKDALHLTANQMASCYIENLGNSKFKNTPLPTLVQVAPVNGMVTDDVNGDGNLDVVMVGNDYGNEVFVGRYDAFTGLVLLGDGQGKFNVMPSAKSGFYVKGDAKALAKIYNAKGEEMIIATQNRDSLNIFINNSGITFTNEFLDLEPLDSGAELITTEGKKVKVEFFYGSGFLSQSSRRLKIPKNIKEITIYDSRGKARKITPGT